MTPNSSERPAPKPTLAAVLSFIWPGLGQAYRGRRRRALLHGLPIAVVLIGLIALVIVLNPLVIAAYLLSPAVSLVVLVLIVVLGLIRTVSVIDAAMPGDRASTPLVIALVGIVVLSHAWLASNALAFYQAGQLIYEPIVGAPQPSASTSAGSSPGQSPPMGAGSFEPTTPPIATPAPAVLPGQAGRVTVLFIGVDNTHGPNLALTDTLIVASFDPITHSVTMISTPRDTAHVPYYGGGEFAPRINTLLQAATRHPEEYPDGPMGTLINEMSFLVGIPIDYYARIDIGGFTTLVDLVGGVDIMVDRVIDDPTYQFMPDEIGFHLDPGLHHMDGKLATAYARSRHGSGNSDYKRADRQQQILLALRARLNDPSILGNLPALLSAVSQIVRTNAPLERLPEIVAIASSSDGAATERYVLGPPEYAHRGRTESGEPTATTELTMDAVAALSIRLFGDASRYAALTP